MLKFINHQGITNKNDEVSSHARQNGSATEIRKQHMLLRMWEKTTPYATVGEDVIQHNLMRESMEFPQKPENKPTQ